MISDNERTFVGTLFIEVESRNKNGAISEVMECLVNELQENGVNIRLVDMEEKPVDPKERLKLVN